MSLVSFKGNPTLSLRQEKMFPEMRRNEQFIVKHVGATSQTRSGDLVPHK